MRTTTVAMGAIVLVGCASAPAQPRLQLPANPPLQSAAPPAAQSLPAPASWDLSSLPLGEFPGSAPWSNEAVVLAENHLTDTPWVIPGRWRIAGGDKLGISGHILEQTMVDSAPVASFVRPAGIDGGQLPAHYKASVLALADPAPRGREAALLGWFQDVTHYVEVVAKPDGLEVWQADGGAPDHSDGWTRLWRKDIPTAVGQVRRLGLDVDTRSGILGIYLDGRQVGEAESPLIASSESDHTLALRSIGGPVYYGELEVDALQ